MTLNDPCDKCEEMMQPFMDGSLSDDEVAEAQRHLERCSWCAKRYRFEERLRHYVRVAVREPMPPERSAKLAAVLPDLALVAVDFVPVAVAIVVTLGHCGARESDRRHRRQKNQFTHEHSPSAFFWHRRNERRENRKVSGRKEC